MSGITPSERNTADRNPKMNLQDSHKKLEAFNEIAKERPGDIKSDQVLEVLGALNAATSSLHDLRAQKLSDSDSKAIQLFGDSIGVFIAVSQKKIPQGKAQNTEATRMLIATLVESLFDELKYFKGEYQEEDESEKRKIKRKDSAGL